MENILDNEEKQTTEDIVKELDNYIGFNNAKEVITDYAEYLKLYKEEKVHIGNRNIIIYKGGINRDYSKLLDIINHLLFKEGITTFKEYEVLKDIMRLRNPTLDQQKLYVIDDPNIKDSKVEEIIDSNVNAVFILVVYEKGDNFEAKKYYSMVDNIRNKFFWELTLSDPTEQEKNKYIKKVIKQHHFSNKTTDKELKAITCYDIETIDKCLMSAFIKATKEETTEITAKELNIIKNPNYRTGLKKLNKLVGLEDVKQQIQQIIDYVQVHKQRGHSPTLHMIFKGNPGTGKTEVARLVGEIFAEYGILEDKFVEVGRNDIVAGYVGQTALKTQKVIEQALGGVLFIDEAYSLSSNSEKDYGAEAISTLIKNMEDYKDNLCVIMAGYPQEMEAFLKSNAGLKSRIQFFVDFPDYSTEELYRIFTKLVKEGHFKLNRNCKAVVMDFLTNEISNKSNDFGNGRLCRNLYEHILFEQATRVRRNKLKDINTIIAEDVTNAVNKMMTKPSNRQIGFST